jgi:hypothetical protein
MVLDVSENILELEVSRLEMGVDCNVGDSEEALVSNVDVEDRMELV